MKIIATFILFLLTVISFGQTNNYYPFPESNALWNIHSTESDGNCMLGPIHASSFKEKEFSYIINGDSTFSGKVYHKVYSSTAVVVKYCSSKGGSSDVYSTEAGKFIGMYRQDTLLRKIYKFDTLLNQECLLYNFDLNIGDSISNDCFFSMLGNPIIIDIDSVLIGNSYRKRIRTNSVDIIEGIGSNYGPFGLTDSYVIPYLVCFSQEGKTLYPDSMAQCSIVTVTNELNIQRSIALIFPNPFSTSTTVSLNEEFVGGVINIFNIVGIKVMQQDIVQNTTLFTRNNLDNGIYLYKITSKSEKIITGKIIVQ